MSRPPYVPEFDSNQTLLEPICIKLVSTAPEGAGAVRRLHGEPPHGSALGGSYVQVIVCDYFILHYIGVASES